jgi:hypothetical protein
MPDAAAAFPHQLRERARRAQIGPYSAYPVTGSVMGEARSNRRHGACS